MNYAFVNARLLDGTLDENGRMRVRENAAVFTIGQTITGVYVGEHPAATGYTEIDLHGQYLLPGLINLHAHLVPALVVRPPKPPKPGQQAKKLDMAAVRQRLTEAPFSDRLVGALLSGVAKNTLYSGVTTLRTVGGVNDADAKMRDRIKAGKAVGPRMVVANTAISVPGGHMAGLLAEEATSPEQAETFVQKIAATGPDLIKLMVTGGVLDASESGEPGVLKMDPAIIKAACDAAHALGYPVAAHTESTAGVLAALENGVDTIEHGAEPTPQMLRLFKDRGAALVCTLSPALPYVFMDPAVTGAGELGKHNGTLVFNGIVDCAKACLEAGIPVGLGTDTGCPYIAAYDMWRELDYFVRFCGVTPDFALHTATAVNAAILGLERETGTVAVGKSADLIVAAQDPLADFAALRELSMVCTAGRLIRHPKVKRMPAIDTALDAVRKTLPA